MATAERTPAGRWDLRPSCAESLRVHDPLVPESGKVRVFLLDDHELVRRGLRDVLEFEDDLLVVGEADSAETALARIPATRPDVAVLDVRLPDGNGIEVCREVRSRHPEIKCLILTSFADDEALFGAIMAGASGYVLKEIRSISIVDSIRRVAKGESLLDPALTRRVLERLGTPEHDELDALTGQERKILVLITEGLTNREIAERLFLAEKTVKNYVSHLLAKLGMSRRAEVAAYGARLEAGARRSGGYGAGRNPTSATRSATRSSSPFAS